MFPLIRHTTRMEQAVSKDNNIRVAVFDYDGTLMKYCVFRIRKSGERKPFFQGICNKEGVLLLKPEEIEGLKGQEVEMLVEGVGFFTEKKFILQPGRAYTLSAFLD